MKLQLLSFLLSASAVHANWAKNINYRSPSDHHPGLGVSIHKVIKRNDPKAAYDPSKLNFTHGVASGDPYPDSVILWTRVAPTSDNDASNVTVSGHVPLYNHDTEEYVSVSKAPVCVQYKVASDKGCNQVVDHGTVYTSSDIDYTVKVRRRTYWQRLCESNRHTGRSEEFESVHHLLLSIQRLRLQQHEPYRKNEDYS